MTQITLLARSIESLAEGEGDLTTRLQIQGDNELSRISLAFNRFVAALEEADKIEGSARERATAKRNRTRRNQDHVAALAPERRHTERYETGDGPAGSTATLSCSE